MDDELEQQAGDKWGDVISEERQAELEERLLDWEAETDHGDRKGPFDNGPDRIGVHLTGADVFWLAARTLSYTKDAEEIAFDMERLRKAQTDALEGRGTHLSDIDVILEDFYLAHLHLERADLRHAHLEGAILFVAHMEGVWLYDAHLERADLRRAHLEGARLGSAHLEETNLEEAHLERADLLGAHLKGVDLDKAHLEGADLLEAHAEGGNFGEAHLEGASLRYAALERADLRQAHLQGADLVGAHLEGALFDEAHLEGKTFRVDDTEYQRIQQWAPAWTRIEFPATLPAADFREAFFSAASSLRGTVLGDRSSGGVSLADVRWGEVNLAVVDWSQVALVGDERRARKAVNAHTLSTFDEKVKEEPRSRADRRDAHQRIAKGRLQAFQDAARANRQLATVLRSQGLTDEADRFAYRAQLLQRQVLLRQARFREKSAGLRRGQRFRKFAAYLGSGLLDLVAGYGYRPGRSVIAYIVIIAAFAGLYLLNGRFAAPHLRWDEALVLSISSFHGRGFFTTSISLGDTLARLAAGEAIIGLLLEITFIATFTQRFFAH